MKASAKDQKGRKTGLPVEQVMYIFEYAAAAAEVLRKFRVCSTLTGYFR